MRLGKSLVISTSVLTLLLPTFPAFAQVGNPSSKPVIPGRVTASSAESTANTQSTAPAKKYATPSDFLVTTTSVIENYRIVDYKGIVVGAAVREPTWSENASAGLQEPYGGSLDAYAQMCEEARQQAFSTLVTRARETGANAIVGVHFDSQSFPLDKGRFASGVVCVGTAVVIKSLR